MYVGTSGDEENTQPTTTANLRNDQQQTTTSNNLLRYHPYDKLTTLAEKDQCNSNNDINESADNDLISNLLGIRDKSIIDRVLQASADDAAKLLGVKDSHEWSIFIDLSIFFSFCIHNRALKKI